MTIDRWLEFWEQNGTAVAILAMLAAGAAIHYVKVILPRAQAQTQDQRAESQVRAESQKRIADAVETMGDCLVRYDLRFDSQDRALSTLRNDMNQGFDRLYKRRSDGTIDVVKD